MAGPSVTSLTAGYCPAHDTAGAGATMHFKATTGVATVQRLGTLVSPMPAIVDDMFTASQGVSGGLSANPVNLPKTRPPFHVIFQVPAGAANPVYFTWDNNTAPVVGGPGYELNPGQSIKFENAGLNLLRPKSAGFYQVNALTAIQFIAVAATVILVNFSD